MKKEKKNVLDEINTSNSPPNAARPTINPSSPSPPYEDTQILSSRLQHTTPRDSKKNTDPDTADPLGPAYQARQALYSLADGGLFGAGLGQGRAKWDYLPNADNDFIFAIIGGSPSAFAPFADYYRQALEHFEKEPQPVAFHSPGYVAETDEQAREEFFPHQAYTHARIGRERGWGPLTRAEFDAMCGPEGAYFVGSPETVARKIVRSSAALGASRFDLKYAVGTLDHARMRRSIELFGTEVRRYVEDMTADLPAGTAA